MPELRYERLTDRTVIVSTSRASRPKVFSSAGEAVGKRRAPDDCPFCPGHETMTPPEVARVGPGEPETPGWCVRVVPNLYPIVGGDDARAGATGAHEVVVLSPDHDKTFAQLAPDQAVDVGRMLRDRVRAHTAAGHVYVQAFVNHGRAAGASIEHPHAQLVALDFVPPAVAASLARFGDAGSDLVRDAAASARDDGRVVSDGDVVVWCPYAPSAPYETAIAHLDAGASFADATDDQVGDVVRALQDVLGRVASVADDPPYNVVVHAAPGRDMGDAVFHWWIEVSPRLSLYAGFELGTGVLVATMPPEQAAAELRDG